MNFAEIFWSAHSSFEECERAVFSNPVDSKLAILYVIDN